MADHIGKIHPSNIGVPVTVKTHLQGRAPSGEIGAIEFTGKVLEDLEHSFLFEHRTIPGQPLVTEQLHKAIVMAIRRTSSVLA